MVNGEWLRRVEGSTITNATVNDGQLWNWEGSTITNATVNGGQLGNWDGSTITNATVNNGRLDSSGTVANATVNGGILYSNGAIDNATLNDGVLRSSGTIDNATQYGGSIYNTGWIETLEYFDGYYEDSDGSRGPRGVIGTLIIAGELYVGSNWGTVENLQFSENGSGALVFAAYAGGGFSSINALNVDLTFGNILLDLSDVVGIFDDYWATAFFDAFGYEDGFYLSSLFNTQMFSGLEDLASFGVTWGENSFWILNDGVFGTGWNIDYDTSWVSWDGHIDDSPTTPEPATLLILGLGAIGAGFVARRRK